MDQLKWLKLRQSISDDTEVKEKFYNSVDKFSLLGNLLLAYAHSVTVLIYYQSAKLYVMFERL